MLRARSSRRRFLLGAGTAVGVGAFDALVLEPNWLDVTVHDVGVAGIPKGLDGFTVAQITDAHLRKLGAVEEGIVQAVRANNVQLLVMTGDIVDSDKHVPILQSLLSALAGSVPAVVATLGNWEHWARLARPELASAYGQLGARLLVNETFTLPDGVQLVATDDSTAGQPRLVSPTNGRADASILLTHSPAFLERANARQARISLALAGHTHGGQIRLTSAAVPFVPSGSGRFVAGWYDVDGVPAYVSRGTGTSIAPIRFTCRPELPIFRLRQA